MLVEDKVCFPYNKFLQNLFPPLLGQRRAHTHTHTTAPLTALSHLPSAENSLSLTLTKPLEPGDYDINLQLTDNQGFNQITTVKARVCDCDGPVKNCANRAMVAGGMGVPAILGILGGILALLSE